MRTIVEPIEVRSMRTKLPVHCLMHIQYKRFGKAPPRDTRLTGCDNNKKSSIVEPLDSGNCSWQKPNIVQGSEIASILNHGAVTIQKSGLMLSVSHCHAFPDLWRCMQSMTRNRFYARSETVTNSVATAASSIAPHIGNTLPPSRSKSPSDVMPILRDVSAEREISSVICAILAAPMVDTRCMSSRRALHACVKVAAKTTPDNKGYAGTICVH